MGAHLITFDNGRSPCFQLGLLALFSVGVNSAQALALTFLNPHVYLDTVVLLGAIASTHAPTAGGSAGERPAAVSFGSRR